MDIFKIAGIAIITAVLSLTLKGIRSELGIQTALAGGIILTVLAATEFSGLAERVIAFTERSGFENGMLSTVFRSAGIAYITQISSDICRDAGEQSLSSKVEICGRLIIASTALPVFIKVFGTVMDLVGEYL